jgi:hypothetical protein
MVLRVCPTLIGDRFVPKYGDWQLRNTLPPDDRGHYHHESRYYEAIIDANSQSVKKYYRNPPKVLFRLMAFLYQTDLGIRSCRCGCGEKLAECSD